MNTENHLKLQAYLDNELTAEESRQVSQQLANDSEARAALQQLREIKALVAGNELPARVPETREFFWSKIEREVTRLEASDDRVRSQEQARWWVRLGVPFASAALLILLATLVLKPFSGSGSLAGYFHEIETPLEEANAISFHSQAAGMTVVWIDSGSN